MLAEFPIVDTAGVIARDPLCPAVKTKPALLFMARRIGISYEPQVAFVTQLGQGTRQSLDPRGEAARPRVGIGSFKRENMELQLGASRPGGFFCSVTLILAKVREPDYPWFPVFPGPETG
jgi:hypothetical protein